MEIFKASPGSPPLQSSLHALSAFYLQGDEANTYRQAALVSLGEKVLDDPIGNGLDSVLGATLLLLQYAVILFHPPAPRHILIHS